MPTNQTIDDTIHSRTFAEALHRATRIERLREQLDTLRAELASQRSLAESVTGALEEAIDEVEAEIAEAESETWASADEDQNGPEAAKAPSPAAPAPRTHMKARPTMGTAAGILGFLSAGLALAALLTWAGEPSAAGVQK